MIVNADSDQFFYTYQFNPVFSVDYTVSSSSDTSFSGGSSNVLLRDLLPVAEDGQLPYGIAFSHINLTGISAVYYNGQSVSPFPFAFVSGTVYHYNSNMTYALPYNPNVSSVKAWYYPYNTTSYIFDYLRMFINVNSTAPLALGTYRVTFSTRVVFTITEPIKSDDAYLISIDTSLDSVLSKLDTISTLISNQTTALDARLLQVISAINNQTGSGGGTQAIVAAVQAVGTAIGASTDAIVAQQKLSTSQQIANDNANQAKTEAALDLVQSAVDGVTDELKRQAEENQKAATDGDSKVQGMATKMLTDVQSNWEALYFPIEFTSRIFAVFTDGTSSSMYQRSYDMVTGYRYDDVTGGLVAVRSPARIADGERAVTGTVINFPAFSLPIPGQGDIQLWESHSYDIASLKQQFPVFFDALYVISGIVIIYATVAFLIDLFNDLVDN